MSIASAIAVSGLNVATLRLQIAASNIANLPSDGPMPYAANAAAFPAAYTPFRVDQTDVVGGGTRATVNQVSPATASTFDPTAPFADSNGMVASPNIDLASEIVQLMLARYSFTANALVVRADAQLSAALLNITA